MLGKPYKILREKTTELSVLLPCSEDKMSGIRCFWHLNFMIRQGVNILSPQTYKTQLLWVSVLFKINIPNIAFRSCSLENKNEIFGQNKKGETSNIASVRSRLFTPVIGNCHVSRDMKIHLPRGDIFSEIWQFIPRLMIFSIESNLKQQPRSEKPHGK